MSSIWRSYSASLSSLSPWKLDAAKILASQIAIKAYYAGEAAGIRLANREGCHPFILHLPIINFYPGTDKLATLPPQIAPSTEISAIKAKLSHTMEEIRVKNSNLTVHDLKRLLFRCAATLISLKKVRPAISRVSRTNLWKRIEWLWTVALFGCLTFWRGNSFCYCIWNRSLELGDRWKIRSGD